MYARVTTLQSPPDQADAIINLINERFIPVVQQTKGFKGGYWLGDRTSGKGISFTLWETEEDLRVSGEETAPMLGAFGPSLTVETFEVVAQA